MGPVADRTHSLVLAATIVFATAALVALRSRRVRELEAEASTLMKVVRHSDPTAANFRSRGLLLFYRLLEQRPRPARDR